MLEVHNLLKKYGDKTILNIPELKIEKGITHLKGINGSGKSTFSKIVAGLIPFQGEVLINGDLSPISDKVAYRKMVNYSDSEPLFPEFLTANDLIRFVGKAKGAKASDLEKIPAQLGVDDYLYDQTGTYSSGMLKRLSLCLAFLGDPRWVLLDEPFNTLDTSAIAILNKMIFDFHENGVNFILVSHQDIEQLGVKVDATFLVREQTIRQI